MFQRLTQAAKLKALEVRAEAEAVALSRWIQDYLNNVLQRSLREQGRMLLQAHLEKCQTWHAGLYAMLLFQPERFRSEENLSEAECTRSLLAELDIVLDARGETDGWLRVLAFSALIERIQALSRDVSMLERLTIYLSTLRHLRLTPAAEITPYASFYRGVNRVCPRGLTFAPQEIRALSEAVADLAVARGRTVEEGWSRLPASVQCFGQQVTELKDKPFAVELKLGGFQRQCAMGVLQAHVALAESRKARIASGQAVMRGKGKQEALSAMSQVIATDYQLLSRLAAPSNTPSPGRHTRGRRGGS